MLFAYLYTYAHTCTHIDKYYLAIKKERNSATCNNMDGPGRHYAKRNESDRERQLSDDLSYMWNAKN